MVARRADDLVLARVLRAGRAAAGLDLGRPASQGEGADAQERGAVDRRLGRARPVVRRRRLPDLREPLAGRAPQGRPPGHATAATRRSRTSRRTCSSRRSRSTTSSSSRWCSQLQDAAEVPAPRPVLGNPRRDRVPRRDARRRRVARDALRLDLLRLRRLPRVPGPQAAARDGDDDDEDERRRRASALRQLRKLRPHRRRRSRRQVRRHDRRPHAR